MTGRVSIVERDGKSYITVDDISTKCDAAHAEVDVMYQHVPPLLSNLVKNIVNTNWRLFKGIIYSRFEKYFLDTVESMYTPVIEQIACEDVYHMQ